MKWLTDLHNYEHDSTTNFKYRSQLFRYLKSICVKIKRLLHFVILITFMLKVSGSLGYFQEKSFPYNPEIFKSHVLIQSHPTPGDSKQGFYTADQLGFENQEDEDEGQERTFTLLYVISFEASQKISHLLTHSLVSTFRKSEVPLFIVYRRLII
jgi:hypothetical protein